MSSPRLPLTLALAALLATAGCRAPAAADAQARAASEMAAQRELISTVTGDPPNFAQLSNGDLMTVVSRAWGRGAKAGALVELYWPDYATDHLWDAYVGVVRGGGKATWAHDLKLVRQALVPDTGRCLTVFEGPGFTLTLEDVVAPGSDAHLRRATVQNTGSAPITDLALAHFAFFTIGHLPAGDRAELTGGALVQTDGETSMAVVADVAPDAGRAGLANMPVGGSRDARQAAEAGDWTGPQAAGPAPSGADAVTRHPLAAIAPGAARSVTWAIAPGRGGPAALATAKAGLASGFDGVAKADADRWGRYLSTTKLPASLPAAAAPVYRRALLTLGQHQTKAGAIIAAPTNLNPPYRFTWPRDGSLIALTMLKAGRRPDAERFFEFAETLQRPDGSFAINYFPDGKRALWDFGPRGNEHDQPGTFAWAVEKTFRATGDKAWAAARWPAVKKACDFLVSQQEPSGLLTTCRDLWELDHDGTWTYSNAAAWAGLMGGAALADALGEPGVAGKYREAAGKMHAAMGEQLSGNGGTSWFGRGIRKGRYDATVEAANLSLGRMGGSGFGAFLDADPRMVATGQAVAKRLGMPGGGVRRYEGDTYYDGQPWPVATAWLATHRMALGDKSAARQGLDVMTRWAGTTEALMLGEQFDEGTGKWASAFPLAWSEAAYVGLALSLD